MHRSHGWTIAALIVATWVVETVTAAPIPAEPGLRPVVADTPKLRGDLGETLRRSAPTEMIPISIVLRDQIGRAPMQHLSDIQAKPARRAAVIDALKSRAAASNIGVVAALRAEQAAGRVGARLRPLWIANVVATEATPEAIVRLAAREDVAYINHDRPLGEDVFPVEPPPALDDADGLADGSIECGVAIMRAPEVWSGMGITGEGVVVGIIDTGSCITHPDLENQVWNNVDEVPGNGIDDDANGYVDDVVGWNFQLDTGDIGDSNGHGTHTAGTVSGDGTNGTTTGMAPNVAMMILEFWNSFSGETTVWESMQYAVDNDADVITASIGWPHGQNPDRVMWRTVCENAIAAGVVVVYAAGNEGTCCNPVDNVRTPGDVPDVITVGATDCNDVIASFSSRGPVTWEGILPFDDWPYPPGKIKPTISAPGVSTVSTSNNCSGYRTLSGTSMATPHVAGAVALMLEANPALDHFEVKAILMDTSIDLGQEGMDNVFGAGRVDAFEAVRAAMESGGVEGDIDGDGDVDMDDLLSVLAAWGPCGGCPEDVNGDGEVNFADVLVLLGNWS